MLQTISIKIYLAHNYSARKYLLDHIVPAIEAAGHTVTSSWIRQTEEDTNRDPLYQKQYAERDLSDIYNSDLLIHFADGVGWKCGRGKFIEVGFAYARGKEIWIVGRDCEESVFYFLEPMRRFHVIDEMLAYLKGLAAVGKG